MQDFWDMIKRPNLQIMGIEGEEAQTKYIGKIFNNVIAEISRNLEKDGHSVTGGF
jgi:hypothetical protein